jgi:hypothetical protein
MRPAGGYRIFRIQPKLGHCQSDGVHETTRYDGRLMKIEGEQESVVQVFPSALGPEASQEPALSC